MTEIKTQSEVVKTLETKDIIKLHEELSAHEAILALNPEPISPKGVKNLHLLESAVSRQLTGSGNFYKYPTLFSNCATLLYGIINNHPFHNGNKRAALLTLMLHLYRNGYYIKPDIGNDVLYEFLRKAAAHALHEYVKVKGYRGFFDKIKYKGKKLSNDEEILFLEYWLSRNTVAKQQTVKPIKWSLLRNILHRHKIHTSTSGNRITLVKVTYQFIFIPRKIQKEYNMTGPLCYPNTLKLIRNEFCLKKEDGFDDNFFLDEDSFIDDQIVAYKKVIYKLSLT